MTGTPNFMARYGWAMHCLGWHVVPLQPRSKRPGFYLGDGKWTGLTGWTKYCDEQPAPGVVQGVWSSWPECGVGIACGNVVGVDIDVFDEADAEDVADMIAHVLGHTPLVRVGRAPKLLLVYQTLAPFSKMRAGPLEVLCHGQQFAALGVHPDTGMDYDWPKEKPYEVPVSQLPVVTGEQVAYALQQAAELLPGEVRDKAVLRAKAQGVKVPTSVDPDVSPYGLTAHKDALLSALEALQNPDLHWDSWNKIGMALFAACEGAEWGRGAWHAYSSKAAKNDPRETDARWNSYHRSPPVEIGAGTLFKLAKEDGWQPPTSLDFHYGLMDTTIIAAEVEAMTANWRKKHPQDGASAGGTQ